MDLPGRRVSSPAPTDIGSRPQLQSESSYISIESPNPSVPSTPRADTLAMNPPSTISHSRRSSFGSTTSGMRRSPSPAPSMPLPAVMPMEASPKPGHSLGAKNASLYANETLTSFFRRLTFTPDGSLLLTPAGQYSVLQPNIPEGAKPQYDLINTVYIYTRGGINKPPIAHLPGHKKPSVVVKCSPVFYTTREGIRKTQNITIDTSSTEGSIPMLPDAVSGSEDCATPKHEQSPFLHPNDTGPTSSPRKRKDLEIATAASSAGPTMAFKLPYRMVYAVATQDSVLLYDTQQSTPLCVVSNLHCATFTDLTWSNDGLTLLMTSSDGFCSTLTFSPGELGEIYVPDAEGSKKPAFAAPASISLSTQNTPAPTPTTSGPPISPFPHHNRAPSTPSMPLDPPTPSQISDGTPAAAPTPHASVTPIAGRPASPTRSNSTSSIASMVPGLQHQTSVGGTVISNPPLVAGNMPSTTVTGSASGFTAPTPPQTPRSTDGSVGGAGPAPVASFVASQKREAGAGEVKEEGNGGEHQNKRRRIAPTFVKDNNQ